MSRDFWRHCWLAFTSRGPYDPTGRDQKIARLTEQNATLRFNVHSNPDRWHVMASGLPRDTDDDKAAEMLAGIVHVHHHIYGTWPPADRVRAALDALDVPRGGAS